MAEVNVIARPGKVQTSDVAITMHAVKKETHEFKNIVTDHPVEEGYNISDHSRPEPEQVTMECTISNTPVSRSQQTQAVRSGQYTFNTTSEEAGAIGDTNGYAIGQWRELKKLRDAGAIVKVVTTLGDYESMAITSISLPREAKNYDAIQFTISFKKIRVVKNKLTKQTESRDPRAQSKKKTGAQTKKGDQDETITTPLLKTAEAAGSSMSDSPNGKTAAVGGAINAVTAR